MTAADATTRLPLTPAQVSVWYSHQLDPSRHRYNVGEYLEIHGPVPTTTLLRAFRAVVAETDAYRVVSVGGADGVEQCVAASPDVLPVEVHDLTGTSRADEAAREAMADDMARPVDLEAGPLLRSMLFRVPGDRLLWYFRAHHVVCDAYTNALVLRRVAAVHAALVAGLPPPARSFGALAALAAEDARYRSSDEFDRDREYWLARLADRPPPIRPGRAGSGSSPDMIRQTGHVASDTVARLRAAAAVTRTSWVAWAVAAMAAFVHRLGGHDDLLLGLPVTGRTNRLTRHIPGMAANVVPLRVRVRPDRGLDELVTAVGAELRGALRHQRYRYEDLRRDLGLSVGDQDFLGPLVNIMSDDVDLAFGGHRGTRHNLSVGPASDLSFITHHGAAGLRVDLDGSAARYTADDLSGYRDRYLAFLDAVY
ncbi:MAG: non-ribosomal peptide synthetase, partial [Saccharothrix sp.]|nr:non-ribosomal peptide synthetase [Saccharothrix sp.]